MANTAAGRGSTNPAIHEAASSVQRYFEISLLLMLGTGFVTLANTGKLDLLSVLGPSLALGVRLWGYARGADWSLTPAAVTRLSVAYIFLYLLDLVALSPGPSFGDRMLAATVHLVLFTTVIKVYSARTYRDYGYLAALSFLMMLASAILTVSTNYLPGLALYVLFATSTFISYEVKRSSETSLGASDPAAGRDPSATPPPDNRSAIEKALAATTVELAAGTAILAAALFFVIPRYRTGYLNGLGLEAENITGFSGNVRLGDLRRIKQSNLVVMRVMVEGNARQFQGVKWRGVGLTGFDGKRWYNDNTEQTQLLPVSPERFVLPRMEGWQKRPRRLLRYRVLLSPLSTDVLFAAAVPQELTAPLRLLSLDQTDSLRRLRTGAPLDYEVISEAGLPSPAELRRAPADFPAAVRLVYLQLPALDPRVASLARKTTAHAHNNYDRAMAIQNYLHNNFAYTLDPASIQPSDPIGSFLFKSKQGYCEYFAAAMALMLRTLHIPSRVVNGFQTGSYNRLGGDFVVRARDAHTWVEVYFAGYGWIPFDPTPDDPNPAAGEGVLDDYLDALSLFWSEWIINYDSAHQVQLAGEVERSSRAWHHGFSIRLAQLQARGVRLARSLEEWLVLHKLLMLCLTVGVMAGLALLEEDISPGVLRFLWRWKFRPGKAALGVKEATLAYQRFLRVLRRKGIQKPASQTPHELALSLAGSEFGRGALEFTRLYNALRFGHGSVPLASLRALLEEVSERRR